jgi:hypothetical protein
MFSIIKANQVMLFREIIAVYCKYDMKQIIKLWGKIQSLFTLLMDGLKCTVFLMSAGVFLPWHGHLNFWNAVIYK